jgi:hypothetical protein
MKILTAVCSNCGEKIEWVESNYGFYLPVEEEYFVGYELAVVPRRIGFDYMLLVDDNGRVRRCTKEPHKLSFFIGYKYILVNGRRSHYTKCPSIYKDSPGNDEEEKLVRINWSSIKNLTDGFRKPEEVVLIDDQEMMEEEMRSTESRTRARINDEVREKVKKAFRHLVEECGRTKNAAYQELAAIHRISTASVQRITYDVDVKSPSKRGGYYVKKTKVATPNGNGQTPQPEVDVDIEMTIVPQPKIEETEVEESYSMFDIDMLVGDLGVFVKNYTFMEERVKELEEKNAKYEEVFKSIRDLRLEV